MKQNDSDNIIARVNADTGMIMYKVTDDLLKELEHDAKNASGIEKYNLYKKLRIFRLNVGKWLVKAI